MTTFQAAAASALPSQAARNPATSTTGDAAANTRALEALTKEPSESQQTGDRDAQEQYITTDPNGRKKSSDQESTEEKPENAPPSIWSLAVEDDTPPSDLDIRG